MGNNIYSLFCTDENGFSYYDTMRVADMVELADVWNLVTDMGDMWMEKDRTVVERTPDGEIVKITYGGEWLQVVIEKI